MSRAPFSPVPAAPRPTYQEPIVAGVDGRLQTAVHENTVVSVGAQVVARALCP
jgi:hypothetical protein